MIVRAVILSFSLGVFAQFYSSMAFSTDSYTANLQETKNADHVVEKRATFNYQMFCQGCHVADGSGHKSVPELKGFMHKFMATQQGREYLIRVPGAANSVLNDAELAEVMNWMLQKFGDSSELDWRPYEAEEVAEYRRHPLNETVDYREKLILSLRLEPGL